MDPWFLPRWGSKASDIHTGPHPANRCHCRCSFEFCECWPPKVLPSSDNSRPVSAQQRICVLKQRFRWVLIAHDKVLIFDLTIQSFQATYVSAWLFWLQGFQIRTRYHNDAIWHACKSEHLIFRRHPNKNDVIRFVLVHAPTNVEVGLVTPHSIAPNRWLDFDCLGGPVNVRESNTFCSVWKHFCSLPVHFVIFKYLFDFELPNCIAKVCAKMVLLAWSHKFYLHGTNYSQDEFE